MHRNWIAVAALFTVLALPAAGWAHEGHTHNVMGTVSSVDGNHVEVKATDGKAVMVMLDAKTAITRGKTKVDATAVKAGERVSVDYVQEKNMNLARAVKLGTAPADHAH